MAVRGRKRWRRGKAREKGRAERRRRCGARVRVPDVPIVWVGEMLLRWIESFGAPTNGKQEQRQGSGRRTDGEQTRHTDALRRLPGGVYHGFCCVSAVSERLLLRRLGVVPHVVDAAPAPCKMHQRLDAASFGANAPLRTNPAVARELVCLVHA